MVKKICCIGAGYVGGPAMAVIALKCPAIEVAVVDVSRPRIEAWNSDRLPVLEPGLDAVVRSCRGRNLSFSADADIVFVSVNTPTKARGLGAGRAADLAYWESAARLVAAASLSTGKSKIVVEKSAVPVRTAEAMEKILLAHRTDANAAAFQVLSNPEFFSEGTAMRDLLCPDRVVIGGRDTDAVRELREVYAHWVPEERIVTTTSLCSAELSKLAANAFLAQRISSANAISALCEATGADVTDVTRAVGTDSRVGTGGGLYLNAGVGFGGPGLQKDVLRLAYACERNGLPEAAEYWRQVVGVNEYQKGRFVRRVVASMFGTVAGKKVAVLGFAFKKGVADTRESPAIDVCRALVGDRARVSVYDPAVSEKQILRDTSAAAGKVCVARDAYEAAEGAHGVCVLTEWEEFRTLDYRRIFEGMQRPVFVFDGRNVVDDGKLREIGFVVYSVGKPLDPWLKGLPAVA